MERNESETNSSSTNSKSPKNDITKPKTSQITDFFSRKNVCFDEVVSRITTLDGLHLSFLILKIFKILEKNLLLYS